MNINSYIRKFGQKSFEELSFNDIDALILAELSYIDIDTLFEEGQTEICINDIDIKNAKKSTFSSSVDALYNKTMLKNMINSVRYKDLVIKDVIRKYSIKDINQFYALNVVFPNGDCYLSYRGTDITLIGWKEDFLITYQKTMLSQIQALEYADEVLCKSDCRFYLGGHSKGGNLAFYTALNLGKKYEDRLILAYSFDGPGFRDGITDFVSYEKVIDKMIKYRTYNDVIGAFFNNMTRYKVVHSTGLLFGGHDPFFWQINGTKGQFMYAKDISAPSKKYSARFMAWLNSLSYDDRALTTDAFFEMIKENETVYDLLKNFGKNVAFRKKSLSRYSENERTRLKIIIKTLLKYLFSSKNLIEKKND
ncbi:MAG: DUF2974 domain-containing protein [Bacilli bacterium]|nr:DUF2974 domain-containing protein [Bacilli bacterium]